MGQRQPIGAGTPAFEAVENNTKLVNEEETIVITAREHMDELIANFALTEWEGSFPDSYDELEDLERTASHGVLTYRELDTGDSHGLKADDRIHQAEAIGLDLGRLREAINACCPDETFSAGTFRLWTPQQRSPYVVESDATPEEWLVYCEYGIADFFQQFGVTSCDHCDTTWEQNRLVCPDCGERPTVVATEIEELRREHDGVACIIGPTAVDPRTMRDRLRQWLAESYKSGKKTLKRYLGIEHGT